MVAMIADSPRRPRVASGKPLGARKTVPKTNRFGTEWARRVIGAKFRKARVRAGLSLQDAAIKADIHPVQLNHYELGYRMPSSFVVQKLVTRAGYNSYVIFDEPLTDEQAEYLKYNTLPEEVFGPTPWKEAPVYAGADD